MTDNVNVNDNDNAKDIDKDKTMPVATASDDDSDGDNGMNSDGHMSSDKNSNPLSKTRKRRAQKQPQKRPQAFAKLALISLIGAGIALLANSKAVSDSLADKAQQDQLQPQLLVGSVSKTLEQFSFTTTQGVQYHVNDPSNIVDKLAKQRGIHQPLYTLERVRLKGLISQPGNYGHMGYYERQLTVTGLDDK